MDGEEYSDEELLAMWEAYVVNGRTDKVLREQLARYYWPLVKRFTSRMALKSPADRDNIESWAAAGLMRAMDNYDPIPREGYAKPVTFQLYLSRSMRSLMLDGIRKEDFAPRSLRKRQRTLEEARAKLQQELGRQPSDFEVADELGLDVHSVQQTDAEVKSSWIDYIEDNPAASAHLSSLETSQAGAEQDTALKLRQALAEEVSRMQPLPRTLMALVHFEEMKIATAAEMVGVSEPHAKQVYQQAVAQCHEAMMRSIGVLQLPL